MRGVELAHHVPVDGVELFGPVEADDRGAVAPAAQLGQLELHPFCRRRIAALLEATCVVASVVMTRTNSCFWILPEAVAGRTSKTSRRCGSLNLANPPASRRSTTVGRSICGARSKDHTRAHALAEPLVGQADHGRAFDLGHGDEQLFDLTRRDVEATRMMISFLRLTIVR